MSLPAETNVYTGFWINWSRGAILGSTITLNQRNGGLLTAFLGIFVTVAGAACWTVQSFLIHQHRVKKGPSSAIHHQQQVVLRNSNTAGSAAWQILQVAWRWRKIANGPALQSLALVLLAASNMLLFGIAGVFSAEVTKAAGNETLIHSPNCGYLSPITNRTDLSTFDATTSANALEANDTIAAAAYSRACYGKNSGSSQCHQLPKPNIPWRNRTNVPCPFKGNICKDGVGGFEMDTGFIDSLEDLGINSKASEALQLRKITSCSVIRTKEYAHEYNITSSGNETEQLIGYDYAAISDDIDDFTYVYNKHNVIGPSSYTLISYGLDPNITKPIAELDLSDADVTLMFLAPNSVSYKSPVSDPLYQANIPVILTDSDDKDYTTYSQDFWVSVLACAEKFQLRNPANGKSTSLTSSSIITEEIDSLLLTTELQYAIWFNLYYSLKSSTTFRTVHSRGANSLRASDIVGGSDFLSPGLPDNQWQIEATELFSVSLATLQQKILSYATGPTYFHEGLEFSPGNKDLCQRQKIRGASGYLSFSVFGVSIILVLGCLFIITALVLDSAVGLLRWKYDRNDHKRLQWAADENLQLQRVAFEQTGQGTWTGGTDAVPMTGAGALPGIGSEPDKHHPRFTTIDSYGITSEPVRTDMEAMKPLVTTREM